ncbi:DUF1614 domain-containing protein [Microvirga sp. M2]|uniref:DUF1614 domain-containing protein n=1 Tax=Microvirga sp. M2 TaxID=3073270 RepID=UPI0039C06901
MHIGQTNYLPLSGPFFLSLFGLLSLVFVLVQIGALQFAYRRMGLHPGAAWLLLLGSLLGSYVNLPIVHLPEQQVVSGQVIDFFGMKYVVPIVVDWPGTIIAVNVGGALIPGLTSIYLASRNRIWWLGAICVVGVAGVCHTLAQPVRGLGIALPVFVPALSSAIIALLLSRRHAAPLAYIGGSLGALIGADLLNLDKVQGLGAPIVSIGGAGTFDGVFVTGVIAVLLASLTGARGPDGRHSGAAT